MELALNIGIATDCDGQVGDGGKDDFWILQVSLDRCRNLDDISTVHVRRNHTRGMCDISLSHATWKNNSRRYSTADGTLTNSNLNIQRLTNRKNSHKGHMYEP